MTEKEKIIKINSKWMMREIENGEKTQIIRQYPIDNINVGDVVLCDNPYYKEIRVVREIVVKRFCDLTIDDALNEGFKNLPSLKSYLKATCIDLRVEDTVYLYKFVREKKSKRDNTSEYIFKR